MSDQRKPPRIKITTTWERLDSLYHGFSMYHPKPPVDHSSPGLVDFIRFDSFGIRPEVPCRYFLILDDGKRWWNWYRTNLRLAFWGEPCDSPELFRWPGLSQLAEDFRDETWVLAMLLDWWPDQDQLRRMGIVT